MHQKSVIFVFIGILKILALSMSHIFGMIWYLCHDLTFNGVAIVYVKGSACRIHFWCMKKDDATSIMNNSNLIDKKGVL